MVRPELMIRARTRIFPRVEIFSESCDRVRPSALLGAMSGNGRFHPSWAVANGAANSIARAARNT
jgi:hypothetical protein